MPERSLVIGCGALAHEIQHLKELNEWHHLDVQCLDAYLHNTPEQIPGRLAEKLRLAEGEYDRIFIAYADCGTAGEIDKLIEGKPQISRLPGAHCFAALTGLDHYDQWMQHTPGTFWLTDFLVRHFDSMVVRSLGLDQQPELKSIYFGNYTTLVYVAQTDDDALLLQAKKAADFLELEFQHIPTGMANFEQSLRWCAA